MNDPILEAETRDASHLRLPWLLGALSGDAGRTKRGDTTTDDPEGQFAKTRLLYNMELLLSFRKSIKIAGITGVGY